MILWSASRYILATKRDDECFIGSKADGSWERGGWNSRVFFKVEAARDIGDEAELTSSIVSLLPDSSAKKRTRCRNSSKYKNFWAHRQRQCLQPHVEGDRCDWKNSVKETVHNTFHEFFALKIDPIVDEPAVS